MMKNGTFCEINSKYYILDKKEKIKNKWKTIPESNTITLLIFFEI